MADQKTTISMRLPSDLMAEVDERAEKRGINRTQWFENMIRWVLVNTYTTEAGIQMGKDAKALAAKQAAERANQSS